MLSSYWSSDVGSSVLEQVDFGRPAADALDLCEQRDRLLVVGGERREVEIAVEDELREAFRIALLLRRQAAGAQQIGSASWRARARPTVLGFVGDVTLNKQYIQMHKIATQLMNQ